KLNPPNPSEVRFHMARLLRPTDAASAKRHLIDALVGSPRYRDALASLQEMSPSSPTPSPDAPEGPKPR
ncbi:MAG TPA: hypothetical protein P5016_20010, partial [Verrucomicrobiales bacterium]|nr:hypothetical protein [Verrucomicrobiales bacterium]